MTVVLPTPQEFARDVAKWPEFIAFSTRLGIDLSQLINQITIELDFDSNLVVIDQRYYGADTQKKTKTDKDACNRANGT